MKKGFTLIETLIALSILAITILGIYSLVNNASYVIEYSEVKSELFQKAYERFLIKNHYTDKTLPEIIYEKNIPFKFKETKTPTILPQFVEIRLQVSSDNNDTELIYYEIK